MVEKRTKKRTGKWKAVLAVVAVVVVIIAIVVVAGFAWQEKYDDDYFVSDDEKLVIGMNDDIASLEDGEYEPGVTYLVYYYNGDKIDSMKVFFAYDSKESAAVANENITMDEKGWATNKKLNSKFIVFDVAEDQYDILKTEDVRKIIEDMKIAGTLYEPDVK